MRVPHIAAIAALLLAAIGANEPAPPAAMFTAAQAHDGLALYGQYCSKCHAAGLTGGLGPDLFGRAFTASSLSMGALNAEVTREMPQDNPGSLTPAQYAAIIAYLLAANCYPAGPAAYPADGPVPNRATKVATQDGATAPCAAP